VGTSASLVPASIQVEAGSQTSVILRVRNTGSIVDRFDISVVGQAAGWARPEPATLSLFPGAEGQSLIVFAPPRASVPRAGIVPFGVKVTPAADPDGVAVEEGRVEVLPFVAPTAQIVPQTSRGSRTGRHEVVIENGGNATATISVVASDPDRLLTFAVEPGELVLGAGERASIAVTARAKDTFALGARVQVPFAVEIATRGAPPVALRATFVQEPVVPGWAAPAAGLVAAGVLAFAFVLPNLANPGETLPPATPTPGVTADVTAPPVETPSEVPSEPPSETPSDAPPESPTPVVVTPPPAPTAPEAQARLRLQLEDLDYRGGEVGRDKVNPSFTFATDGPGLVRVTLRELSFAGDGVVLCLGPQGRRATCETLTSPGAVSVQNDATDRREWVVTAQPGSGGMAPEVDLVFTFNALRPVLTLSDNGSFNDSYTAFTAFLTAGPQSELRMAFTYTGAVRWLYGSPRETGQFGTAPPLEPRGPEYAFYADPVNLGEGRTYEIRFMGNGVDSGESAVDYQVEFKW
jgi:hypothetical protein